MRKKLQRIRTAIEEGQSLSGALEKHAPKMFPKAVKKAIEAGERSGTLAEVLKMLDGYCDDLLNLRRKAKAVMIYPTILSIVFIGSIFFYYVRIFPTFAEIYADLGSGLPAATQVLIDLRGYITGHPLSLALALGCILLALISFVYLARRISFLSKLFLRIPFFGTQRYHANLFSFSSMMSILVNSGAPTHEALSLCEGEMSWPIVGKSIRQVRMLVSEGMPFSEACAEEKLFSPTFRWLISVGEQRGDLAGSLSTISEFEMARMQDIFERFQRVFEPAFVIVMSLGIGFMIVASALPILRIGYLMM
jgi:type II secretory pathway component PulF